MISSAAQLGNVIMLLIAGEIAASPLGWPGIFYVCGAFGVLWSVLWALFGSESPEECNRITGEEKQYIQSALGQITDVNELKDVVTPWRSILTSSPFWTLVVVQCAFNFGFYTLLTQIPSFLGYFMEFDIKTVMKDHFDVMKICVIFIDSLQNSLLSALPYFILYVTSVSFGFLSDYLLRKNISFWSVQRSRKFFNSIGMYVPMIGLIGLGFMSKEQPVAAMALLCIAVGFKGGIYVGYIVREGWDLFHLGGILKDLFLSR